MMSRVAEHCFWLARYLERAENIARVLEVNQTLLLDFDVPFEQQWKPLLIISGIHSFPGPFDADGARLRFGRRDFDHNRTGEWRGRLAFLHLRFDLGGEFYHRDASGGKAPCSARKLIAQENKRGTAPEKSSSPGRPAIK